jgi:hypothetical protein
MPNRLLPRRRRIDGIQRQGDFDEFFGGDDGVGAGHVERVVSEGGVSSVSRIKRTG